MLGDTHYACLLCVFVAEHSRGPGYACRASACVNGTRYIIQTLFLFTQYNVYAIVPRSIQLVIWSVMLHVRCVVSFVPMLSDVYYRYRTSNVVMDNTFHVFLLRKTSSSLNEVFLKHKVMFIYDCTCIVLIDVWCAFVLVYVFLQMHFVCAM